VRKRDANEADIVKALRRVGAEVWQTDDWDLTVAFRGCWHAIEVKADKTQAARKSGTAARQKEHRDRAAKCGCEISVVMTELEALRAIGAMA